MTSIYSSKYNFSQVFILADVVSGKCYSGKCDYRQMLTFWKKNVQGIFSGKLFSGKCFFARGKDTLWYKSCTHAVAMGIMK